MQLELSLFIVDAKYLDEVAEVPPIALKELKPFTNYSIYIMGFNSKGAGLASQAIMVQTLEDGKHCIHSA